LKFMGMTINMYYVNKLFEEALDVCFIRRYIIIGIEENKELVRRYNAEIWNKNNLEKFDDFVNGVETIEHIQQFLAAFSDIKPTIDNLIADGDQVVARLHATDTNTGPFDGNPPTGKRVEVRSIRKYRIADNKIVESWAMHGRLGLMEQSGLVRLRAAKLIGQQVRKTNKILS